MSSANGTLAAVTDNNVAKYVAAEGESNTKEHIEKNQGFGVKTAISGCLKLKTEK